MTSTINKIISAINISEESQIFFLQKPVNNFLFLGGNVISQIELLQNKIYEHFYIFPQNILIQNDEINFIKALQKANSSKNKIHKNWQIEHINNNGYIIAQKGGNRLEVPPGKYILINSNSSYPAIKDKISIYQNKAFFSENDTFYHIFGEQLDENFYEAIVRFYFNLNTKGAIKISSFLTQKFNKNKIPFHFKCLKNSKDYIRADAGVLYLDKRYYFDFMPILSVLFTEIKLFLNPQTPLFTLKLQDGIAFAENPPNPNESFGMSRCRLIAEGIWQAHEKNLPKSEWANSVINYIESKGYDLDKFYLNPNSRFPYDFS